MKALVWHAKRDVRVEEVPDPKIEQPTDAIIKVTSSGLCGSDLHLYELMGPYLEPGDILGHEPMGIVQEVGGQVPDLKPGDRVVIPFNISCGHCFFCDQELYSQCETTQVTAHGTGAALFGYTKLYGEVPGGQAEYLRVPHADFGPIKVPDGPPDDRFVYLSDVLPTAMQAVAYADAPKGGTIAVFGLGPIGQMATRIALMQGYHVIATDLVEERLMRGAAAGATTIDLREVDDVVSVIKDHTHGRGADSVIDAVGMEAHGSGLPKAMQTIAGAMPDKLAQKMMETASVDRMEALQNAIASVRRGGTVSIIGVYSGAADPFNMMDLFDRQIQIRMGQANVKRWVDDLMPLLLDPADPLGTETFATHHVPLGQAPEAYAMFQRKQDGAQKVLFTL